MKKIIVLLSTTLLFQLPGTAQFSLHVFPMGVSGDPFADTLLNTRAILVKEGIKTISTRYSPPVASKTFTSKKVFLNGSGNIDTIEICFQIAKPRDSAFCIGYFPLYDDKGRMVEVVTTDAKGNGYPRFIVDHLSDYEVKYLSIDKFNYNQFVDTLTDYKYFNEKGQVTRLKQIRSYSPVSNTTFHYNNDGLFDSIVYENSTWGTFTFKRSTKRHNKVIEMENSLFQYRWIYNSAGQCINTWYAMKNQAYPGRGPGNKYTNKTDINYYYNTDGTLSSVTQKGSDGPAATVVYSYTR